MGAELSRVLAGHRPEDAREAADLERVRALGADPYRRDSPLHVTLSALILHPATARVLLRWHPREERWLQVGGHADPGESDPLAIALREGREETGLDDLVPWPDERPVQLVVVSVRASAAEPAHEHADLRYLMITERPETVRPENPQAELRWLPLAEALAEDLEPTVLELLRRARRRLAGWAGVPAAGTIVG